MLSALMLLEGPMWVAFVTVCTICIILIFIAAVLAILCVLFQKSNSDGIQGITSSSETFFGKHKGKSIESRLKKWTWILLAVIAVFAIAAYIIQIIAGA